MIRKTKRKKKTARKKTYRRVRRQRGGSSSTNPGPPSGTYKKLVNCWRCVQDGPNGTRTWREGSNGCNKSQCPGWDLPVLSAWSGLVAMDPANLGKIPVKKPIKGSNVKTVADQMNYFGRLFGLTKDGMFG